MLPIDRTNLTAAQTNQVPNALIRSALNIAAIQTPYDTIDELYNYTSGLVAGGVLQPYPAFFSRQALINGGFAVNQRVVSGTVTLAAGAYGHDRWKAGAAGCTYTFATSANVTTITITAGSLIQVVEGINLSSGTYTLSWTGTAQGKIGSGSYGTSGITGTATGGTNLNIEFNVGTLSKVGFNAGVAALPFQSRSYGEDLALSLRYYWKSFDPATSPAVGNLSGLSISTNIISTNIRYTVPMRVSPTFRFSQNNILNQVRQTDTGAVATMTGASVGTFNVKGIAFITVTNTPFTVGKSYDFDIEADSEL